MWGYDGAYYSYAYYYYKKLFLTMTMTVSLKGKAVENTICLSDTKTQNNCRQGNVFIDNAYTLCYS